MAKANTGDFIRRYTSIAATIDILARGQLPLLNPETWDDRNDRHFMNLYKEARTEDGVESLYALCAATCPETYHHWRVFTSGADGACLELRRAPLEEALRNMPNVRFDEVKYLTLEKAKALNPSDLGTLPSSSDTPSGQRLSIGSCLNRKSRKLQPSTSIYRSAGSAEFT